MENKLTKEHLMEIVNNSDDDAPERKDAEFILDTLYDENMQEISEDDLEEIAGGSMGQCAMAAALSLGLLGGSMSFDADALAKARNTSQSYSVSMGTTAGKPDKKVNKSDTKKSVSDSKNKQSKNASKSTSTKAGKKASKRSDKKANKKVQSKKAAKKQVKKNVRRNRRARKGVTRSFTWPAPGFHHISSGFYDTAGRSHMHGAIDICGDAQHGPIYGARIVAANSGTVVFVCTDGYGGGYGNNIIIDHGNGKTTLYAHLSSVSVSRGQRVARGQEIGRAGNTGFVTGPHLHFEYRVNGVKTDPAQILRY